MCFEAHYGGAGILSRGIRVSYRAIDCNESRVGSRLGDEHIQLIAAVKELIWLSLNGTNVSNAGILQLAGLPNLEYLELSYTTADGSCLRIIKELPSLLCLEVAGLSKVADNCPYLYGHNHLSTVNFENTDIATGDVKRLLQSSNITSVSIEGTEVVADGLLELDDIDVDPYRTDPLWGIQVTWALPLNNF